MDAPPADPFAPWLGADDLELLQNFQAGSTPVAMPSPPYQFHSPTSSSSEDEPRFHPPPLQPPQFQQHHFHHHHHHQQQLYHQHHQQPYYVVQHHELHHAPYAYASAHATAATVDGSFTALMTTTQPLVLQSPSPPPPSRSKRTSPTRTSHRKSTSASSSSSSSFSSTARPASPPSDSGVDLSTLTAEEARREKNRQKVRRHYYRKLSHLDTLRDEVSQLETHFQQLLERQNGSALVASSASSTQHFHDKLMAELAATQRSLERENEQLRRLFTTQQSHNGRMRTMLANEHDLFLTTHLAKTSFIKPFSAAECHAVRDQAVEEVLLLTSAQRNRRNLRGAGIAGWQDEVSVENGFFKFALSKTFRDAPPTQLCAATWPMMVDPRLITRMYSAAVEVKCVVVQEVDDRNVVLFQEYRTMDANNEYTLMKSLYLASRAETPTGELIVVRGLGEDRLQDRELFLPSSGEFAGKVVWHDIFSWVKFDRAGLYGGDCTGQFGGTAPIVGDNVPFWSVEVLNMVVKWEYAIYGPPLLLSSQCSTAAEEPPAATATASSSSSSSGNVRSPPVEVP